MPASWELTSLRSVSLGEILRSWLKHEEEEGEDGEGRDETGTGAGGAYANCFSKA